MPATLDHVLVPAHDKRASAAFLAEILEAETRDHSVGSPPGHFAVVQFGATGLDFADVDSFEAQHYAFAVDDALFDRALERLQESGRPFSSDPMHEQVGEINGNNDGRGLYFRDPNGHSIELLTRPFPAAGAAV